MAQSKPVTEKQGRYQRAELPLSKDNSGQSTAKWKTSAKQDGVRAQGPTAKASGKAPFPGVMPGTGEIATEEPTLHRRTKDYDGGRSNVQARPPGVRY